MIAHLSLLLNMSLVIKTYETACYILIFTKQDVYDIHPVFFILLFTFSLSRISKKKLQVYSHENWCMSLPW